jgi:hypothetical protein
VNAAACVPARAAQARLAELGQGAGAPASAQALDLGKRTFPIQRPQEGNQECQPGPLFKIGLSVRQLGVETRRIGGQHLQPGCPEGQLLR